MLDTRNFWFVKPQDSLQEWEPILREYQTASPWPNIELPQKQDFLHTHFFRSKGGLFHALISDPTVSSRHQANCRNQRIVEKVGSPKIVCRMPVVDSPQRKRKACIEISSPRCLILPLSLPVTWNRSGFSLCPHHIKFLFYIPKSMYTPVWRT